MRSFWAILVILMLFTIGCKRLSGDAEPAGQKRAVTTVAMVRDIVAGVAGDKISARSLLGAGVDPHLYKPTRDDVARLIRADIIFYNGLFLEGKMVDVLEKMGKRKPAYAVAAGLDTQYLLYPHGQEAHPDPHVWMDVSAWIQATKAVEAALVQFDAPNADYYHANAATYVAQLEQLDEYGRKIMATIPPKQRVLISSHDAFNYFGRHYDISVMGVQGLSTESEAGLRRINELVGLIAEREVRAVFVESSVPRKSIEALIAGVHSHGGKLEIGGELFTDAMGEAGTYEGTYIGMMDHNLTTVVRALGGDAPERGMLGRLAHVK